ncbi:MAG: hypothetical protein LBL66_01555 [Clostridiales bacterium]|jgi:hypothetical protein|nr:hypothetical protein [Clostridiales bacterium]
MSGFVIQTNKTKDDSVIRTIRIKGDTDDKLVELSEQHKITFNKLVNQCIEYALENLTEKE